ncbi:MAG TPA: hypothetical protein VGT03_09465 [Candidatus Acidoferrales bacterium]|nr:hypothetical protein [Candidatus Acidoferrales bacterium]
MKQNSLAASEIHDIFVRAHTVVPDKQRPDRPSPVKWSDEVLIFDTETTIDTAQKLNFGFFRRCKLGPAGYNCVEEGLFHADDLDAAQREVLERFINDPANLPQLDVKMFPPPMRLRLYNRSDFVNRVFWKAIRKGAMIVGFNLPYDLSRLPVKSAPADDGGWSLALSMRKSRKTGEIELNPERPRVVITSKGGKLKFISLKGIFRKEEWPIEGGRFLDLRTLGWALRNESLTLADWCDTYNIPGKLEHTPTGRVTFEEIKYCRRDVQATANLLNAMKEEFDRHPIDLQPDRAYSPASIAKAYLEAMNIANPAKHFGPNDKESGVAMQGYYGGRAECRIRKSSVPVVLTDFTSQYPTVNALLGNWDVLTADGVSFEDCTVEVREIVDGPELEQVFDPTFWKRLSFFALVQPDKDILPVRTVYNGRTQNIGLNYLTSTEPIWFAGPDIVASRLLTGKSPRIIKAIRMVPHGRQSALKESNLARIVPVDPRTNDFFRHVVEQKSLHKPKNKALSYFLKILGNAGSYGLFVEVNPDKVSKPVNIKVFSGEISRDLNRRDVEKTGAWYFPPMASLITSGGRLLLAMLECCVRDAGGTYLFCDTDSLCIVSNEHGGLVSCPGGQYRLDDRRDAIKALSWKQVEAIANRFNSLNPYNRELVREILKIEDVNFVDLDRSKPRRQLWGYGVSAKRYALFTQSGAGISIVKASGHGLGYLYPPKDGFSKKADAPVWVVEAWDWMLRKELGLPCKEPDWLDYPAMMRMTLTSPNVLRGQRPGWLAPFNFFFFPLVSELGGYPAECDRSNFRFIVPFTTDRTKWGTLVGINLNDGRSYAMGMTPSMKQDKVVPESLRIMLRLYLHRAESKSLAPDGSPCVADTQGLLRRASILAGEIVPVGKETDRRWEEGEDIEMLDFKVADYRAGGNMVVADKALRDAITKRGLRTLMRETKLSQHTIEAIRAGKPVRRRTLKRMQGAMALNVG